MSGKEVQINIRQRDSKNKGNRIKKMRSMCVKRQEGITSSKNTIGRRGEPK